MLFNKEQVLKFLPHRDPFLFIDGVKELILSEALQGKKGPFTPAQLVGCTAVCTFKVDHGVKVLEGHFPGNPILPGVVQIEMMAQAASFLASLTQEDSLEGRLEVLLLGTDGAKFRKPVIPPMDLEIRSKLTKVRGPIQMYECEILSNGELISQASVMASLKII